MIKVQQVPSKKIQVRLKPHRGIKVGLNTTYLFDNSLIQDEILLAKDWATKTDGKVEEEGEEIDYSAKAWAVGGTGTGSNNAKFYAEQAGTSASNAYTSETNAAASALSASEDATTASTKAGLAATSESNALSYSQSAASSANDASHSAGEAYTSETNAASSASTATTQAGIASSKATEASGYASSALASKNAAATSESNAEKWAEGTDAQVEILGGEHSSKGWAKVAKDLVDSIGSVLHYKGSVASSSDLPTSGQELGDMYNVIDTGANYVWDGSDWDEIGGIVDMSLYRTAADQDVIDSGKQPVGNYVTTDTAQSITAQKTFESSTWNGGIKAKRTSSSGSFVVFENSGGVLGGIGMDGDSKPLCANSTASSLATLVRSGTHTNPATGSATQPVYIDSNGIAQECSNSIPTSADYWTVGMQGVSDYQTTYSKKMIFYKQANAQDNGFRMLGDSDTSPVATTGAWSARCLIGNEKRTFLLGTARNSASGSQSICGMGAHSWGSASSQTSAAWDNIYIQPDGSTAVYLGGNGWRGSSGWLRVQNNNSGSASYRVTINTGTNTSPSWKTVLPNNATGTSSILFTPTVSTTHTYTYATSVNGTVTANYGSSLGYNSSAGNYGVALGASSVASGNYSIQIGYGTNSTANTMSVGLSSSLNVQLLDASGEIPDARIKTTIARTSQIPTDNASLTNGAGYITSSDIPVSDVTVGGTSVVSSGTAVIPAIPSTASDVGALPDSTKYGADLSLTGGTLQLLDQDGNALGNSVTVPDTSDFVQKIGDTMTGELIVEDSPVTIQNTTFDSTTTTAPAQWTALGMFRVFDENGNYTGYLENAFTTGNYVQTTLGARRIVSGENKSATIKAMVDSSGNGRVEMYPPHIQKNVSIINGGVTKGTSPSVDSYNEILFNDKTDDNTWANTRLGAVQHVTRANGGSSMLLRAYRNQAASTSYAEMSVTIDSSGTASCSFPNTVRCDGQWVESSSQPGDSVNMNASTNVTYTLTQIPNDGHKYMVLVIASPVTGSTSGNFVLAQVSSTICAGGINVCRAQTRTNSTMAATGAAWIPVGSDRKITLNRSTSYTGTCNLYVRGYRRIGDNG